MDNMLTFNQIHVSYEDVQVLWDVSFEVREKEILLMVGANGAGKSTTLRTISGLLRPFKGSIEFKGIRLDQIPDNKIIECGIAHVPEGRHLFPEMTVEENLVMGSLSRKARSNRSQTLKEVYHLFPRLEERSKQLARTLSGGEQQMCALGRGMMALPDLLLLDEPSMGLSPIWVQEIFKIIERIKEKGVTILLVEQNVTHSLAICDRAYVLENGRIVLEGNGQELLGNPHVREAYLGI
jgi:branched-chain amino acid transport system ATP-binding protein